MCDSVNKHVPMKEITVNIRKFKSEPWMMIGIKRSSQKFKKLYKLCLEQGRDSSVQETYVLYRNCFK